ncbi:MAG: GNAT family N-acetyltransferase [Chloroflexota bacterium]
MKTINAFSINMNQRIRLLEEISANAWPAPYTIFHDGWLLRYANGYTRRANSAMPLYRASGDLEAGVTFAERFYNDRALPTFFKMTTAAEPMNLDEYLGERGYSVVARTSVQSVRLSDHMPDPELHDGDIDVRTYPSIHWLEAAATMNRVNPMYHNLVRQMLTEHLLQQALFVMVWDGTRPIATAMIVLERGFAGIFDVVVHKDYRGYGCGRKLVAYALWLAQQEGAHTAYLQVMLNNERAWRLYAKLGFTEEYQYWYREKPLPV